MKNIAINNIVYSGEVTISKYKGDKKVNLTKVHNAGYNSLFSFLANCLVGDFYTARFELPTKIRLLYTTSNDTDGSKTYEAVSPFIHVTSKPERVSVDSEAASSAVCYSFAIPRTYIENTNFNSIGLYADNVTESTNDIESFAAFCKIDGLAGGISDSSLLLVDWKLTITNND